MKQTKQLEQLVTCYTSCDTITYHQYQLMQSQRTAYNLKAFLFFGLYKNISDSLLPDVTEYGSTYIIF
jgi:hypothetical protein